MTQERKDYTKVTELSREFAEWKEKVPVKQRASVDLLQWQIEFQLCIAQQLTIIAQHLGKIVDAAETRA